MWRMEVGAQPCRKHYFREEMQSVQPEHQLSTLVTGRNNCQQKQIKNKQKTILLPVQQLFVFRAGYCGDGVKGESNEDIIGSWGNVFTGGLSVFVRGFYPYESIDAVDWTHRTIIVF